MVKRERIIEITNMSDTMAAFRIATENPGLTGVLEVMVGEEMAKKVMATFLVKIEGRIEEFRGIVVNAMDELYTEEEINALHAFYSTEMGRAVLNKFQQAARAGAIAGQELGNKVMQEVATELGLA